MTKDYIGLRKCCEDCGGDSRHFEDSPCTTCNNEGFKDIPDNQIVYVNAYRVTREYGGPEEGGWWYNWFECIETFPVRNSQSDLMLEQLYKDHEEEKHGDIYSVLGGADLVVYIEERPKESETRERPYYC